MEHRLNRCALCQDTKLMPWRRCVRKIFGKRSAAHQGPHLGWGQHPHYRGSKVDLAISKISAVQTRTWISQAPSTEGGTQATPPQRPLITLRAAAAPALTGVSVGWDGQEEQLQMLSDNSQVLQFPVCFLLCVTKPPSRSKESSKISSPFQEPSQTLLEQ